VVEFGEVADVYFRIRLLRDRQKGYDYLIVCLDYSVDLRRQFLARLSFDRVVFEKAFRDLFKDLLESHVRDLDLADYIEAPDQQCRDDRAAPIGETHCEL
jgi:predicted glycosyltransferase